ncbi:MAG: hypothetical protein NC428_11300, partial [Clostridium sp.]|nr:hypothetical protein [Clostridium sp.]
KHAAKHCLSEASCAEAACDHTSQISNVRYSYGLKKLQFKIHIPVGSIRLCTQTTVRAPHNRKDKISIC